MHDPVVRSSASFFLFSMLATTSLAGDPVTVDPKAAAPDVRPTLEQIFLYPRLLGTRAQQPAMSADAEFVVYRRAVADAAKPELETWLARVGGGEPMKLFDAKVSARAFWSRQGADLFVIRDGWLEINRVSNGATAGAPPAIAVHPLAEVGARAGDVVQFEDGRRIAYTAGDDTQLYVLDLVDGSRRTPAADLKNRASWFAAFGDQTRIAIFADRAAPASASDAAKSPPAGATSGTVEKRPSDESIDAHGTSAPDDVPTPAKTDAKAEKAKRVLWILTIDGSIAPKETKFEEGDNVKLFPSGRFALRESFDRTEPRRLILADYLAEQVTAVPVRSSLPGDRAARIDFEIFDLEAGKKVELALDAGRNYWTFDAEFARASDALLLDRVSDDSHVRQLLLLDPATRVVKLLYSERDDAWIGGPTQFSALSRDGAKAFFTAETTGFNHLYEILTDGSALRDLTPGESGRGGEIESVTRVADTDRFLVTHNQADPACYVVEAVDPATGARRVVSHADGVADAPRPNPTGTGCVYTQARLGSSAEVFAARLDTATPPVRITATQPPELDAMALPQPEIVEYANPADGTIVRAFVYKPPGFEAGKRYPLVVFVHGAGYLQQVLRSMTSYEPNYLFHQRLARKGYVVLDPDYRHSKGYGRKFRTDVYGFMGGKDLDDVVAGIDFLAKDGAVDPARVGIYGGSYGGFLTLMALFTKPDRFAAGCALRSVTDWRTYNAWYTNPRLGDPKKDAENYARSSPIDHADGLKKPLLLLHGLKDSNVFAQDTIRLVEKLIELHKQDFEVMLYPSQDHGFTDADSWLDEYRRIERFFDRHVRDSTPAH